MSTVEYFCRVCQRRWLRALDGQPQISCTVVHANGECCHYGETEVPA